ncbi:M28 family peptidase [Sphingomonas lenta]|uniref:Peptidase M28 n=1 Tax=Sphingomonas lenta TaxID=1141887 RepID=A0A2A2SFH8_9SPHN|nr:M28 family peptidase [Sphingomonas lenta]PAX07999.1 peptidase M28 [Sphingomonas lenta]
MRNLILPLLLATAATASAQAPSAPQEAALRAHVAYLASDAMRGREAGTPDYDRAADYVAKQMQAAGLQPGANGRWLQPVPLVVAKPAGEPVMTLTANGATTPLVFGTDYTLRPTPAGETIDVSAPVVFAGHGVVDPAIGRNDYRGLDVRGKVVAVFYSGPQGMNSEVAAHLGNRVDRARTAAAKGARGIVFIESNQSRGIIPVSTIHRSWDARAVTWAGPDGMPRDGGAPILAIVSQEGAAKLFAGSKLNWEEVRAADAAGRPVPTGQLAATLATKQRFTTERLNSSNVVGLLPGSDPKLRGEYVVLSGHLDHVGIGRPDATGDTIHNGAMDNAVGIASMIEVAKRMRSARPKRSVLFVAVTAEEKGLIGSDYFATYPTVPKRSLVANVNLDMPILTYRFQNLVAFGADRSGIGPIAAAATKKLGFALVPDPAPQEASFVRTDHYSFVRQGVPAVSLVPGPGGGGTTATAEFIKNHYHKPSDEIDLPFDWTAAANFVSLNHAIATALADAPERPRWVKADYFGTLYKGPMAR